MLASGRSACVCGRDGAARDRQGGRFFRGECNARSAGRRPALAAPPAPVQPLEAYRPGYPAPSYSMPPIPPEPTPRKKGMLVAGLSTFGGSFLFSVLFGFELYESNSRDSACPSCRRAGKRLLIPLVGPWLAMPSAQRPIAPPPGMGARPTVMFDLALDCSSSSGCPLARYCTIPATVRIAPMAGPTPRIPHRRLASPSFPPRCSEAGSLLHSSGLPGARNRRNREGRDRSHRQQCRIGARPRQRPGPDPFRGTQGPAAASRSSPMRMGTRSTATMPDRR